MTAKLDYFGTARALKVDVGQKSVSIHLDREEGFKLAEQSRSAQRPWFWALLVASGFGALAGFWAMLHLMYQYGAIVVSRRERHG